MDAAPGVIREKYRQRVSPILLMLFSGTALALALFLILTVADIKGVAAGVAATVIITAVTP